MLFIEPTMEYAAQIRAFRQAFLDSGDSMDGTSRLRHYDDPADWIAFCESEKHWATQYIYLREEDGRIVGMLQLRRVLNGFLERYGGHIGYCVAPGERRRGYATRMLGAALPMCGELGMGRVLVTCLRGNEGSRQTILRNGGVYESTVFEEKELGYIERYWIGLP